MDEDSKGKDTERRELDVAALVIGEAKQGPARGQGWCREDELKRGRLPAQQEQRPKDCCVEPEIDDGHGNAPLAPGFRGFVRSLCRRGSRCFRRKSGLQWSHHRLDLLSEEQVLGSLTRRKLEPFFLEELERADNS